MVALSACVGPALQCFSREWLARAPSRSGGLIHLGMLLLAGAAAGLAAARWWALPQMGPMGALTVGSLAMLALGGLLELYGEELPSWSLRLRLAVVFGSLAVAIIMFPAYTRWWTRHEQRSVAVGGSSGLSRDAMIELVAGVRTACLIGVEPAALGELAEGRTTQVEVLPLSSWRLPTPRRKGEQRIQAVSMPAPRALRLTRARYQFVYQCLRSEHDSAGLYCSAEWLGELNEHLAEGGILMVDVPLSGLDPAAVVDIAGTFQHVSTSPCFWATTAGPEPRFLLCTQSAVEQVELIAGFNWSSVNALVSSSEGRVQSIRSGRVGLSSSGRANTHRLLEWLSAQAGHWSPVARVATPRPLPR
jgi:hypothetical protein